MNPQLVRAAILVAIASSCSRVLELPPLEHGTIRGRVVAATVPVAGARLRLDHTPFEGASRLDGTFVLRGIPRGRYHLVTASDADSDGRDDRFAAIVEVEIASAGEDIDVRDLELAPAATLNGVVRGAEGAIPGTVVFLSGGERLVPTDGAGRFRIGGVPPGVVELWASAPGHVPTSTSLEVAPGESRNGLEISLIRSELATGTVSGSIRLATGEDPGDIRAQLLDRETSRAIVAIGGDGLFRLGPIAPGTYELRVDASGYETAWVRPLPIGLGPIDVGELWLRRGPADPTGAPPIVVEPPVVASSGEISGRVLVDGEPRELVTIRLAGSAFSTTSRLDGSFTLDHVPLGAWIVEATQDVDGDGLFERARRLPVELTADATHLALGDLALLTAGAVSGRVVGGDAAPRPGALVVVTGTRLATRTADDGTYELVGVPRGAQTLAVSATGHFPGVRAISVPDVDSLRDVDFALATLPAEPASHAISGAIRFVESPEQLASGTAQAFRDGTLVADAVTGANGAFHLQSLPPGLYSIRVDAPGRRTLRIYSIPVAEDDVDLGQLLLEAGSAEPAGSGPPLSGEPPAGAGSPRALLATGGDLRVTLTWSAPDTGGDSYVVYRSDAATGPFVVINSAAPTTTTAYIDRGVVNYRTYTYKVTAIRAGLESPLAGAPLATVTPGAGTVLGGPLRTRRLVPAGNPHVVLGSDLVVLNGETLTIDPGTELRFGDGLSLVVEGTLVARGTADRPITFTRHATSWNGITFGPTATDAQLDATGAWRSGSVLAHAIVEQSDATGLELIESAPLIEDTEIRDNSQYTSASDSHGGGVRVGPGAAPLLRRCFIHHNVVGTMENDTTSSQWGAGLYSEGDPIIQDCDFSSNELRSTSAGNSSNYGAAIFLRTGRATLSASRIAGNVVTGTGQSNTGQWLRLYGAAIYVDSGTHLFLGNSISALARGLDLSEVDGTVYVRSGSVVMLHNVIADSAFDANVTRGGALALDRASILGYFNVLARNRLSPQNPSTGSAIYVDESRVTWSLGDFIGAFQPKYEVYNTNTPPIDLSSNHFAALATTAAADVFYRPGFVDASDVRAAPIAGAGPKLCRADTDCAALGGDQRCHYGACIPTCFIAACAAGLACDPEAGTCGP